MRKATIIDVARAAGVSKSTVSLVLQGSPRIRSATTKKVQAAIHRLGYVYNRGAANLRSARTNVVGMVINDLAIPSSPSLRSVSSRSSARPVSSP